MSDIERDIDPPEPVRYDHVKIKRWWIGYVWDDGYEETMSVPDNMGQTINDIEQLLDEIEYEVNRDILENQAQKYGDPDGNY